jgi:putative tryptophan/tyrosine transport system substrate-binding protein
MSSRHKTHSYSPPNVDWQWLTSDPISWYFWAIKLVLLCSMPIYAYAKNAALTLPVNEQTIAVLYPQIKAPYHQIFASITDGIQQAFPGTTKTLQLEQQQDLASITTWLTQNKISAVISLGSHALKFVPALQAHYPVIVGATSLSSNQANLTGISMLPSPHMLLVQLKKLQPKISHVHVVLNQQKQDWWLEQAIAASKLSEHQLVVHSVTDLVGSAQQHRQVLQQVNSNTEALWLVSDHSIMDSAIMRNILEIAWDRELLVFSNMLADVQRGALFSMYPDNLAMGKSLALQLIEQLTQAKPSNKLQFLSDLLTIVNIRTAKHIGLHFTKSELQSFDLLYPVQ